MYDPGLLNHFLSTFSGTPPAWAAVLALLASLAPQRFRNRCRFMFTCRFFEFVFGVLFDVVFDIVFDGVSDSLSNSFS